MIYEATSDISRNFGNLLAVNGHVPLVTPEQRLDIEHQHTRLSMHYNSFFNEYSDTHRRKQHDEFFNGNGDKHEFYGADYGHHPDVLAVQKYTGAFHKILNHSLVTSAGGPLYSTDVWQGSHEAVQRFHLGMQNVFSKAPALGETVHSFAGIGLPKVEFFKSLEVGSQVKLHAYTSTTIDPHETNFFVQDHQEEGKPGRSGKITSTPVDRHYAHFETGQGARNVLYIDPISMNPSEKELLINAGSEAEYKGKSIFHSPEGAPNRRILMHHFKVKI